MKAARIHAFGSPAVIVVEDVVRPTPGPGEVLVRAGAAGVGPWDALIRAGRAAVKTPLPLTLGSEVSGVVEAVGAGVSDFKVGEEVYGATNREFIGGYTEYALASAAMVARKPRSLNEVEAASVPVVGVTAWQMLFDYARATAGQTVLIHGGAGNVGAYAVQLASQARLHVIATAGSDDISYVQNLGAERVLDYRRARFEDEVSNVDIVIDTVGGETRKRSTKVLKRGGILVSVVSPFPDNPDALGVRSAFFVVYVTTARLNALTELFDRGKLTAQVATVLPLEGASAAHQMLAEGRHQRGKIVLKV
jgi:NADPH:quinone reductase-like Zn-dependent oxidoreductase